MKIFGYPEESEMESPLSMSEVTICASEDEVERIIRFFEYVRVQMQKHGDAFGHEHLEDFDREMRGFPGLIVHSKV